MSPYFSYLYVLLQAHFHLHCYNLSTSRCLNGINLCGTTMEIAETRLFQEASTIVVVCCMFVMYVCMLYLHMCAHACGMQSSALGVIFYCSPSYFLRHGVTPNLELTNMARLAGQQAPVILLPPTPQSWNYRHTQQ